MGSLPHKDYLWHTEHRGKQCMFVALEGRFERMCVCVCVWRRYREREKARVCIEKNSIRSVFSLQGWSLNILFDSSELKRREAPKKRKKQKRLQLLNKPVCLKVLHFTWLHASYIWVLWHQSNYAIMCLALKEHSNQYGGNFRPNLVQQSKLDKSLLIVIYTIPPGSSDKSRSGDLILS